jgi:hypothetical protein
MFMISLSQRTVPGLEVILRRFVVIGVWTRLDNPLAVAVLADSAIVLPLPGAGASGAVIVILLIVLRRGVSSIHDLSLRVSLGGNEKGRQTSLHSPPSPCAGGSITTQVKG